MKPSRTAPDRPPVSRRARRARAALLGALALLLLGMGVKNALVHRTIRRVNAHGGWVLSYADPLPRWPRLPASVTAWLYDVYPAREDYRVVFYDPTPLCGSGLTLLMSPSRVADPGDEGLAVVSDLGRVRWLDLQNTSVADAGLRPLRDLRALEMLGLEGTRVAGPGLAHLRGLPLRELVLARTPLDDAGLMHLDELPALWRLDLGGTRVTAPGLAHLARFGALRNLRLVDTSLDDRALGEVAALPVTHLALDGTAVSDAGLDTLASMSGLVVVSFCGTRVTSEAARRSPVDAIRRWGEVGYKACSPASVH